MSSITIRGATRNDAPKLAEMATQLGYPTSERQARTRLEALLESQRDAVLAACLADGSMLGWIHVFLALRIESQMFAELGGLVVREEHRGLGIGTLLACAAESWAAERGAVKLRVRCRSNRVDALAFYERRGFVKTKDQSVLDRTIATRG